MTVYSHSRLSAFEKCPLSYKYKYLDKIKPEVPFIGIEAYMGSAIHGSLEDLYKKQKRFPDEKVPLAQLLDKYETIWKEKRPPDIKIIKEGTTEEDYFIQGKLILTEYYQTHQPFSREETLSVEERIDINIEGFKVMGFIDRLALNKENGNLEIFDYKTSGTLPDAAFLQKDRQLSIYQMGVRKKYPQYADRNVEVIYDYLKFNKEFRFQKMEDEISAVKKDIVDLIQTIELASWENDFKPRVGKLCRWCEFSEICAAFEASVRTDA
ncbi:MAG: PD-(D/E)XK nuclease family protein [Methanosarcinales archaeon]|jgi:putative RecB family exonuclease|nr:PD-(D/E)XK nuclease family protein [Methanosarcinales archaeon]